MDLIFLQSYVYYHYLTIVALESDDILGFHIYLLDPQYARFCTGSICGGKLFWG